MRRLNKTLQHAVACLLGFSFFFSFPISMSCTKLGLPNSDDILFYFSFSLCHTDVALFQFSLIEGTTLHPVV